MLKMVGESETRLKQILRMAAVDRDAYDSFVEMYRPEVEKIESRDTYYDWDYPFESYDGWFGWERIWTDSRSALPGSS